MAKILLCNNLASLPRQNRRSIPLMRGGSIGKRLPSTIHFPVLVSATDTDLRDKAQDDSDDILFMDGAGVAKKLYHEIEHYDDSTGELVAWVNIPSVSHDEDTVLYMYYGNPGCSSQQVPERVWDSDYLTVLHMKDDPDDSHIRDSTSYDNDGAKKGSNEPIETTGKIGRCQNLDGSDDYIDTTDFDIDDDFTVSLWINPSSTENQQAFIGKHTSGGHNIVLFGHYAPDQITGYSTYIRGERHREGVMTTGWQHFVCVSQKISSSETKATVYKDGAMLWQHNLYDTVGNALGKPWTIGQDWDPSGRTDYFNGMIDEVRIYNSISGSAWISTEYNNQNDPSSFLSFGPEETGP